MKSLPIQIPTVDGYLSARLELPDTPYKAVALFAHCFTCGKDILAASRIAKKLASYGLAVLRFDFTGLGGSEGDFSNTNFSSNLEDITHAANWLASNYQAPTLLIGHSLGGTAIQN
jgi:putative redox protein